jgi:hypothetical protein
MKKRIHMCIKSRNVERSAYQLEGSRGILYKKKQKKTGHDWVGLSSPRVYKIRGLQKKLKFMPTCWAIWHWEKYSPFGPEKGNRPGRCTPWSSQKQAPCRRYEMRMAAAAKANSCCLWIGRQSSFLKVQDGGDGQEWRRRVPRTGVEWTRTRRNH